MIKFVNMHESVVGMAYKGHICLNSNIKGNFKEIQKAIRFIKGEFVYGFEWHNLREA
jgi:hypothetical protein